MEILLSLNRLLDSTYSAYNDDGEDHIGISTARGSGAGAAASHKDHTMASGVRERGGAPCAKEIQQTDGRRQARERTRARMEEGSSPRARGGVPGA
jgi:hypothetical protein